MTIDNIEFPQTSNQKKNNINQPGFFPCCITPLKFNMGYQEMAIFQKDSPFQSHHSWGPPFVNVRGCIRWAPTIAINGVMGPNKSESLASFSLKLLHSSPGGVAGISMATPAPWYLWRACRPSDWMSLINRWTWLTSIPALSLLWWCTPTTPGGIFIRIARPSAWENSSSSSMLWAKLPDFAW